jgi:hypothetical protein
MDSFWVKALLEATGNELEDPIRLLLAGQLGLSEGSCGFAASMWQIIAGFGAQADTIVPQYFQVSGGPQICVCSELTFLHELAQRPDIFLA